MTFSESVKVISVNVNGIRARERQLRQYIQEQGKNCIYALSDTRLTEGINIQDIDNFSILRQDKVSQSVMATAGGVALLIPNQWSCVKVPLKSLNCGVEALAAVLLPPGKNSLPLKILVVYNHPGNYLPLQLIKEFKNIKFNDQTPPGLLVGDLNSPHTVFGSRTTNEFGNKLLQNLNQEDMIFFNNGEPTYISNATGLPNVLDLAIGDCSISPFVRSCYVSGDIGSDHYPLITTLDWNCQTHSKPVEKTCLQLWAQNIENLLSHYSASSNIDENIINLNKIFQLAKEQSTKIKRFKKRTLPPDILQNIHLRKILLQNQKKATSELSRKVITKQYNRINKLVQKQIKQYDDQQVEKLANQIASAPNTCAMWKMFNRYKQSNKAAEEPETPLSLPNGNLTANSKEKCDEFARYLSTVHQVPGDPIFDSQFKFEVDTILNNEKIIKDSGCITPINIGFLRDLLTATKTKSAPGEDYITYGLLKVCSDQTLQVICNLFNQCLISNVFPSAWKTAKVVMLPKPGRDKSLAASYRPISLLSALGKVYERWIHDHLMKELFNKKFFCKFQAGFLKGRSTHEHLFRLSQDISNGFKKRHCTLGIFLDVQAAFDAVWKNGLLFKIRKIGLSKQLQNILYSFMENRTLRVCLDGVWSDVVELGAGTPQGACLSPILYLIYVNDLMDDQDLTSLFPSQYADDAGLWSTNATASSAFQKIQAGLNKLEVWCKKWHVTLNPRKSKVILFTKCPRHKDELTARNLKLRLFGEEIGLVQEVNFLGVIFDQRLTWEPNTRKIVEKGYKRLNLIRMISSQSANPKPDLLSNLYKATIRSIFEYGSISYINAADVHLEKLQSLQNQALRVILKMPAYVSIADLHDASGIPFIKDHLTNFARMRLARMRESSPIIHESIERYNLVGNIQENSSVLDILSH